MRRWALRRFAPQFQWGILGTVAAMTMSGGVSFIVTYFSLTEREWLFWVGVSWIVLDIGALLGTLIFVKVARRRRGKRLLELVERGTVHHARVLANQVDYFTPTNGAPKIVVALEIDGRLLEIRAFDSDDADLFPMNSVLEVVYAESIPEIVFPTARIPVI